jgi:hypothetical protein
MRVLLRLLAAFVVIGAIAAASCSPEASRKPGEPGADVGNRKSPTEVPELHGKSNPAYQVPTVGAAARK